MTRLGFQPDPIRSRTRYEPESGVTQLNPFQSDPVSIRYAINSSRYESNLILVRPDMNLNLI